MRAVKEPRFYLVVLRQGLTSCPWMAWNPLCGWVGVRSSPCLSLLIVQIKDTHQHHAQLAAFCCDKHLQVDSGGFQLLWWEKAWQTSWPLEDLLRSFTLLGQGTEEEPGVEPMSHPDRPAQATHLHQSVLTSDTAPIDGDQANIAAVGE